MKLNSILIIAATLICCSPNSKTEDNLIGNWNNNSMVIATKVDPYDPSNTIIEWDTIDYTRQIQFNSNKIMLLNSIKYRLNDSLSTESKDTLDYIKSNDTLNVSLRINRGYYKYKITNDSLLITYLYGDTIKYDSLTPLIINKFKKQ